MAKAVKSIFICMVVVCIQDTTQKFTIQPNHASVGFDFKKICPPGYINSHLRVLCFDVSHYDAAINGRIMEPMKHKNSKTVKCLFKYKEMQLN